MGLFGLFGKKKDISIEKPVELGNVILENVADFRMQYLNNYKNKFMAIDFETSGLDYLTDKILEIGVILFENGIITDSFHTYVDPGIKINGINNRTIKGAPNEINASKMLYEFLSKYSANGVPLVAHNADFDMSFLSALFIQNGIDFSCEYIDTLAISKILCDYRIKDHKLNTVAESLLIKNEHAHSALCDAETCGKIFFKLISNYLATNQEEWDSLGLEKQLYVKKIYNYLEVLEDVYMTYKHGKNTLTLFYLLDELVTIKFLKTKTYAILSPELYKLIPKNFELSKNGEIKYILNSLDDLEEIKAAIIKKAQKIDKAFFNKAEGNSMNKFIMRDDFLYRNQPII